MQMQFETVSSLALSRIAFDHINSGYELISWMHFPAFVIAIVHVEQRRLPRIF